LSSSESKPDRCGFACPWRCGVCLSVCAENAISHRLEIFVIDRTTCSECRLCLRACPAGVIQEDLFA
jgi:Fe-S-cluster-containing hydrogenase component 2